MMGDESDSSGDCFVAPRRRNFNPKPHLVRIVKSDTAGQGCEMMGDESDSSGDCFVAPRRRNFNPKPHLVRIVKSDTGNL
ncbi:unnamed protein product [Gongylonema pulchrum]|uniref:Uncharacterized protein n=1 Tax=Gongylonema pulchrum TaxID=637853 RepID=A0A183ESP8_9BILA|nr:unnamed protein product [Gongylonema pulchrum]